MLISTTSTLDGKPITSYLGLVSGEAILGANIFRDIFAGIRDIVGGRSARLRAGAAQGQGHRGAGDGASRRRRSAPTPSSASIWTTRTWGRAAAC